jgi:hypothetical protein
MSGSSCCSEDCGLHDHSVSLAAFLGRKVNSIIAVASRDVGVDGGCREGWKLVDGEMF